MAGLKKEALWVRLFVLSAVLAIVAAACGTQEPAASDGAPDESAPAGSEPAASGGGGGGELGTYTLGIFEDVTTDNAWNYNDTEGNTVWNGYLLGTNAGAAYTIAFPGLEMMPDLAEGELQPPTEEGDGWVGTFSLKEGLTWSDGEPITAEDFAFTWNTAVDLELQGGWVDYTDPDIITAVEAVDDLTVQVSFNAKPGLAIWGPGTSILLMPLQPEHFWAPIVEEAAASDDPRTTLLAASGEGAPSSGPTVFSERQEGSFAAATANESWWQTGEEFTSGDATWTEGPFADEFQYPLYGGQEAAVLALSNGEVDLLLNPLGMQRGFQDQVSENEELTAIVNPTNGYRFLAFNHARAPMSDPVFRDALTALINKEFVTENLLQGVAFPLYVILPEGNVAWYDDAVATELAEVGYAGLDDNTRRQTAIDLLKEAGYTWETEPTIEGEGEEAVFTAGAGLIGPDGEPVGQLELITPTASYDPLRATFANYISGVSQEMGIDIVAIPTDFNKIVNDVFALDAENNYTSPFDMFILGYSLGNPAFPSFHCSFFCTGGDSNNTQYTNEDYDAAADAFDAAETNEEAFAAMWEMERLIARDKPHVPLFDTGILEFYNNRVAYPFTETLSGLQNIYGLPSSVSAR
jgi:peptide/nickel transport system substrate-binding protein